MVRVVGNIGTAINGTLHIKPTNPFVGVDAGYKAYPVIEGLVDIDLAPTPRGVSYLVDFQPEGTFGNPVPQERWSIPPQAEVSLDLLRFPRQRRSPEASNALPNAMRQVETEVLRQEHCLLQGEVDFLKEKLSLSQEQTAIAERKVESLRAEVAELKTNLYLQQCPREKVVEKVVEVAIVQKVGHEEAQREQQRLMGLVSALRQENQRLLTILEQNIMAQTMVPDEDVAVIEMPVLRPNASPAQRLDFLLRQQEG